MKKVAIIGSGSWGAALGIYLANNGNEVRLWSFNEEEKRSINENRKCVFLPKAVVPEGVICSTDFKEVLDGAEIILHVTPSKFVRSTLQVYKDYVKPEQPIIMCSKGFEPVTEKTFDVVIEEEVEVEEVSKFPVILEETPTFGLFGFLNKLLSIFTFRG